MQVNSCTVVTRIGVGVGCSSMLNRLFVDFLLKLYAKKKKKKNAKKNCIKIVIPIVAVVYFPLKLL